MLDLSACKKSQYHPTTYSLPTFPRHPSSVQLLSNSLHTLHTYTHTRTHICSHQPSKLEVAALLSFLWILLFALITLSPSSLHHLRRVVAFTFVSFSTDSDPGCHVPDRFSSTVRCLINAYLVSVRPAIFDCTCNAQTSTLRCVSTCPWLASLWINQKHVAGYGEQRNHCAYGCV